MFLLAIIIIVIVYGIDGFWEAGSMNPEQYPDNRLMYWKLGYYASFFGIAGSILRKLNNFLDKK